MQGPIYTRSIPNQKGNPYYTYHSQQTDQVGFIGTSRPATITTISDPNYRLHGSFPNVIGQVPRYPSDCQYYWSLTVRWVLGSTSMYIAPGIGPYVRSSRSSTIIQPYFATRYKWFLIFCKRSTLHTWSMVLLLLWCARQPHLHVLLNPWNTGLDSPSTSLASCKPQAPTLPQRLVGQFSFVQHMKDIGTFWDLAMTGALHRQYFEFT